MTLSNTSIASNEQEIIQVIHNYVQGTETNNVSLIDQNFHENFRVVAMTKDSIREMDKQNYLSLLEAKEIGGEKRVLLIKQLSIQSQSAQVSLDLRAEKVVFKDQLQLVKYEGVWKIVNNLTEVQTYSSTEDD